MPASTTSTTSRPPDRPPDGWAAVYDRQLYGEVTPLRWTGLVREPPVVAWLAVPFTALPFRWAWRLELPLCDAPWSPGGTLAPGTGWQRLAHLLALLATGPVLSHIDLGQYTLAVMGSSAHWWCSGEAGRCSPASRWGWPA